MPLPARIDNVAPAPEPDGAVNWDRLLAELCAARSGLAPSPDMPWPEALLLLKARRADFARLVHASLYAKAASSSQGKLLMLELDADA